MKVEKKHIKQEFISATECLLASIPIIQERINMMKDQLESIKNEKHIKGIDYSQERVSTSNISKTTEVIALNNIRDEEILKLKIKKEEDHLQWYQKSMSILTNDQKKIVKMRCFERDVTWDNVMERMPYLSESTLKRSYASAIAQITLLYYGEIALNVKQPPFESLPTLVNIK